MATLDPFSSAIGYAVYLSGMHRLYSLNFNHLNWVARESGLDDNTIQLCKLIEQDLGNLSSTASETFDYEMQICADDLRDNQNDRRPSESVETSWGVAYVLEGSSMGARYIVRQVESNNASNPQALPTAFLTCVATESYERWPKFTEALDRSNCQPDPTVEVACQTFASAKSIFQELASQHAKEI